MKEGYKSSDNYVFFTGEPDPNMHYGEAVVKLHVDPQRMEMDENSPFGQPHQRKVNPEHHTGDEWSGSVFWTAPSSAVTPVGVMDFTGNRRKMFTPEHINRTTHRWDEDSQTFVRR
jgi:hypothetical protein